MKHTPFTPRFDDLPEVIPVFPLTGALVMPGTQLPLNIFEPRYLQMVEDALRSDRIIGMIQSDSAQQDALYRVGCAGRITSFAEIPDGRYHIVLAGLCRFDRGIEVDTTGGYRRFGVDWQAYTCDYAPIDNDSVIDRTRLIGLLRQYTEAHQLEVDFSSLDKAPDELLVNGLVTGMPFEPRDAQSLIETAELKDRAQLLAGLMAVAAENGMDQAGARH